MNLSEIYETEKILVENRKTGKEESKIIYKPKAKNGKTYIPLKDEWRDLTSQPEEKVRQDFICKLINDYGYSLEQMKQEVKLTISSRGRGGAYADIVIWKTKKEKEENKTAFLVIELKAEALNLKPEDFYQGYNYATWSRAKLFVISNGRVIKIYKTIEEELPLSLNPVSEIEKAKDILDDKKEIEIDKLQVRYGKKEKTLLSRLSRAKERVEKESSDSTSSMIEAGIAVLGALFGKSSPTKIGRAVSKGSKILKERGDMSRAEERMVAVEEDIEALEYELEDKIDALNEKYNVDNCEIETYTMKPRKTDIDVEDCAIVWRVG